MVIDGHGWASFTQISDGGHTTMIDTTDVNDPSTLPLTLTLRGLRMRGSKFQDYVMESIDSVPTMDVNFLNCVFENCNLGEPLDHPQRV